MKSLPWWFIICWRSSSGVSFLFCLFVGIFTDIPHTITSYIETEISDHVWFCSILIVKQSVHKTEQSQSEQNWEHVEMEIFTLLGLLGGEVGIRPSVNQATPDLPCFYKWVSDYEVYRNWTFCRCPMTLSLNKAMQLVCRPGLLI